MDPPPFFHHPPRYVPLSDNLNFIPPPPPPPPPPQSFSDNLNFYPSHPPPPFDLHRSFINGHDYHRFSPSRVRVPLHLRPDSDPPFRFRDDPFSPIVDFRPDYRRNIDFSGNYDYAPGFRDNRAEIDTGVNGFVNRDAGFENFENRDVGFVGRGRGIYGSGSNLSVFNVGDRNKIFDSPNKQVQKKSALLRIQFNKSHNRNKNKRNEDRRFRLDSHELDTKGFRNRGSERMKEERDGVELDVSFKSNSLVAKAIEVEHDSNSEPKKRKIANVASSPSKKASVGLVDSRKKVVRPMSFVSVPERNDKFEPVEKHGSIKSVVVTAPLDEVGTKLNDKNGVDNVASQPSGNTKDEYTPVIVSSEEDTYVDIGGESPMHDVKEKSNSFSHLSPPPSVKTTNNQVSEDILDDLHTFQSCENIPVEVVSNVDNNMSCPEKTDVWEGDLNLNDKLSNEYIVPDQNQRDTTVSDFNAVDSGGNNHVNITSHCTSIDREDGEIEWNLITPSTVDLFLREVSEACLVDKTTLSSPTKDNISREQHTVVLGTEKESACRSSSLSLDSCSSEFSSKTTSSSNETSPKYGKTVKSSASISSSSLLYEEEFDSVSSGTFTSGADLEDRDVGSKFDALSSVRSSPCSDSGIMLVDSEENLTDNSLPVEKGSFGNINCTEKRGDGKEFDAVEEQEILRTESFQHRNSLDNATDTYQKLPVSDMECDHYLPGKDSLPSFPTDLSLCTDGKAALLKTLHDKRLESESESESESDKVSNSGFQETLPVSTESQNFKTDIGVGQISEGMDLENLPKTEKKPSVEGPLVAYSVPTLQKTSTREISGHAAGTVNSLNPKFVSSMSSGVNSRKSMLPPAVPKSFRSNLSMTKTAPTSQNLKPRTWQRSSSPSPQSIPAKHTYPSSVYRRAQSHTVAGNIPSVAYVRKGNNSLVRTAPPVSATTKDTRALGSSISWLNPSSVDKTKKITGNDSKVNLNSLQSSSKAELNAISERPNTPPLQCSTKISNYRNHSSGSATSAPTLDPLQNVCLEAGLINLKLEENKDLSNPSNAISEISASHEYLAGQIDSFESHSTIEGNVAPINMEKSVYIKRKANQLVGAASSSGLSAQNPDKIEVLSSAGYIKRRKHQLVRKSLDNGLKIGMSDEYLNSQAKSASQIIASSFQKRSGNGIGKTCKPSRFSLVWTLHDAESLKKDTSLLSQVWPNLFPWKRATHRRRFTYTQASAANNGSLSSISRKLLLSRQRKTIYKRSTHGLSLSISKVLSVSGSSLKWSKSIEKNSKKANEDATLAVAAVERKKRWDVGTNVTARTKSRNHTSRERIFRVGSVRYKMDPTRRTLQRISDEESCSFAVQSGKAVKKSSVPRRLVIGNQEYVRIGNGNKLVRDPKKRTRILANEKVRWSLHTARLCLARKKQYCQFFTRFGKCNKGGGKCPYIHDSEKIAVCTKFLKGSCSDSNCKLTHKVIPERMQDCSFFLQGLCSNETCPYRHVNVNPAASFCEGFLRGYCADGDECRKKHSYVCPIFESTGTCPQRSKCKLHHPKIQNKGKRKEPFSKGKNNVRGRYFGLKQISVFDTKPEVSSKPFTKDDDDMFFQEGKSADFIPLDVSDGEESVEPFDSILEQTSFHDSQTVDIDIDDLIMPVGIMKRKLMKDASPTV